MNEDFFFGLINYFFFLYSQKTQKLIVNEFTNHLPFSESPFDFCDSTVEFVIDSIIILDSIEKNLCSKDEINGMWMIQMCLIASNCLI